MHIFVISGKAQSGKDAFCTIATFYFTTKGYNCTHMAFADEVKRIALQFEWDGVKDEKGRSLLQWIGDGGRKFNPNMWINKLEWNLFDAVQSAHVRGTKDNEIVFITDARYPNEVESLKKFGKNYDCNVHTIRIVRPLDFDNGLTPEQKQNSSETALDDYTNFDNIIANIGTLEEYENKIEEYLKSII